MARFTSELPPAKRRVPLGAEAALGFAVGAASFALVAVILAVAQSDVLAIVLGVACIAAVAALAWRGGAAYAAPAAIAALLAYDWYQFPPTHPREFPGAADLAYLLAYLAVAVLIGELAAHAARRAEVSEVARSELAEEQAALRRVATLVARAVPPDELFAAVGREVGLLLGVDGARVVRYDADGVEQLAGWTGAGYGPLPVGRVEPVGTSVTGRVRATGRVSRIDDYASVADVPAPLRTLGIRSAVGAPIVVDGRLWGAMLAWLMHPVPLPRTAEARLADFTELIATAISNAANREQLARLADEQSALRSVATLVARGVAPSEVFAAVAREVGRLLDVDAVHIGRYEPDGTAIGVANWSRDGAAIPVGTRSPMDGESVTALVLRTGRPARIDGYPNLSGPVAAMLDELGIHSSAGAPVAVDGRLWGVMVASSKHERPLPPDTESRIAAFTELAATAISNTEARAESGRLADRQAALRRVATLVARESPEAEIFAAVAEELGRLLAVEDMRVVRYEDDETATVVGSWGEYAASIAVGTRHPLGGENVTTLVRRTGRAARMDDHARATGVLAELARELGTRSAVGGPIVVNGRLWGAMVAGSRRPAPAGTEARIDEFTELVATAISNLQARSELAASRARVVQATDDERRRVVRDLHDGAQQRMVHTVIMLKLARRALERELPTAPDLLIEALEHAERANVELRELAHGILPTVLAHGGLRAGVEALASRMQLPVERDVPPMRLAPQIEATAYFIVAEALTNVVKHSRARHATVTACLEQGVLRIHVRDDGVGGARLDGNGLLGVADRLAALDGRLRLESPDDGGTLVEACIPVSGETTEGVRPALPDRA